jgi:hypothetical protein
MNLCGGSKKKETDIKDTKPCFERSCEGVSAIVERKFVWATLTIASLGSFAIVIDSYFLNVAITTLVSDLHTTCVTASIGTHT